MDSEAGAASFTNIVKGAVFYFARNPMHAATIEIETVA